MGSHGGGRGRREQEVTSQEAELALGLAELLRRERHHEGAEPAGGGGATAPPPLANHELRLQLELGRGRGPGGPAPQEENLPRMLAQRQWGRCRHSSFSPGEQTRLSSHFLPNRVAFADSYPQKAFCGVFDPNGDAFVSACQDQTLRLYRCRGGGMKLLRTFAGRDVGWSILDVVFSPDGGRCFYCSWSDYVHMIDVYGEGDTHTALDLRPRERRFAIFSLAVAPGGGAVLGGANDGCIYGYDLGAMRRVLKVSAHEDDVNAVALDGGEGQLVLSGGDDGVCRGWDRRLLQEAPDGDGRPRPVVTLAGHRDGITFLHPRGDGRYLVTNSKDQSAKLWDLRLPAGPTVMAAARRAVANQSWDYRWQPAPPTANPAPLPGDRSLMTFRGHVVLHTLLRARLAPPPGPAGGQYLSAACATGAVIVYDVLTGRVVRRLANHGACVRDVSWHPRGDWLASASWDGSIRLWDYGDPA
ncbi:LOW QUALITY PROTEIN: DDB1- and CUL4-associated factor 11 [Patagioenas fasciata]|uniref:LOW QUALITY PROTEIN: DDB1- and CUL4-associated factor 11 n=1 Tax=Patagioenas fasciata TaxID=372321 RepID=UPI003A991B5E